MTVFEFLVALMAMLIALSAIMTVAWLVQQRSGNSGWVDTIWTFGVGLTGMAGALVPMGSGWPTRQILVASFAAIWALRLGVHIASRSAGISNDPRYAEKIEAWGSDAPRQMFWFLQVQAIAGLPLVMSIFVAAHRPDARLSVWDAVAILVMIIAVCGEGIADWQLNRFKSNPANKGGVNEAGLWKLSRHPNYFFEALGWLAYPLIAIDLTGGYPWGFIALSGAACMYWLLVYVSGIPLLEKHMLRSRGEAFRAYQRRTNAFFPGPPRD